MTMPTRKILFSMLILSIGALAACNTVEGAGKDIDSAGDTIQDAAQ